MTVSVRDARASGSDRAWIESVYREYLDDLAPPDTGLFPALGEVGHREPDQIARWFADPGAIPLIILKSSRPAGFAMVARGPFQGAGRTAIDYRMGEFFIARQYRRLGVGRSAVQLIFDRFAGRWEITEHLRNRAAVSFWRRVLDAYTNGRYQERIVDGEVRQVFRSGTSGRQPG